MQTQNGRFNEDTSCTPPTPGCGLSDGLFSVFLTKSTFGEGAFVYLRYPPTPKLGVRSTPKNSSFPSIVEKVPLTRETLAAFTLSLATTRGYGPKTWVFRKPKQSARLGRLALPRPAQSNGKASERDRQPTRGDASVEPSDRARAARRTDGLLGAAGSAPAAFACLRAARPGSVGPTARHTRDDRLSFKTAGQARVPSVTKAHLSPFPAFAKADQHFPVAQAQTLVNFQAAR